MPFPYAWLIVDIEDTAMPFPYAWLIVDIEETETAVPCPYNRSW